MKFKVVYCFHYDEKKANQFLKKIPKLFSKPHLEKMPDGSYAVIAGEYNRKDWADSAVHKLYENKLFGGILHQNI